MPTPDAQSILLPTDQPAVLQARIAALQAEVDGLRTANAQLQAAAGRPAADLTARKHGAGLVDGKAV